MMTSVIPQGKTAPLPHQCRCLDSFVPLTGNPDRSERDMYQFWLGDTSESFEVFCCLFVHSDIETRWDPPGGAGESRFFS